MLELKKGLWDANVRQRSNLETGLRYKRGLKLEDNMEAKYALDNKRYELLMNTPKIESSVTETISNPTDLRKFMKKTDMTMPAEKIELDSELRKPQNELKHRLNDEDTYTFVKFRGNVTKNFEDEIQFLRPEYSRVKRIPNVNGLTRAVTSSPHLPFNPTNFIEPFERGGRNSRA